MKLLTGTETTALWTNVEKVLVCVLFDCFLSKWTEVRVRTDTSAKSVVNSSRGTRTLASVGGLVIGVSGTDAVGGIHFDIALSLDTGDSGRVAVGASRVRGPGCPRCVAIGTAGAPGAGAGAVALGVRTQLGAAPTAVRGVSLGTPAQAVVPALQSCDGTLALTVRVSGHTFNHWSQQHTRHFQTFIPIYEQSMYTYSNTSRCETSPSVPSIQSCKFASFQYTRSDCFSPMHIRLCSCLKITPIFAFRCCQKSTWSLQSTNKATSNMSRRSICYE